MNSRSVGQDYCNSFTSINPVLQTTVTNIVTDILLCITAYMIIRSINIHSQSRTYEYRAIWFVVGIATITIVVSVSRLTAILLYYRLHDRVSTGVVEILTEIEAAIVGCAACLPAMRVFLREQRNTFYAKRKYMVTHNQTKLLIPNQATDEVAEGDGCGVIGTRPDIRHLETVQD